MGRFAVHLRALFTSERSHPKARSEAAEKEMAKAMGRVTRVGFNKRDESLYHQLTIAKKLRMKTLKIVVTPGVAAASGGAK
jgi:hypothetical protein